jgi:hypothetical protein
MGALGGSRECAIMFFDNMLRNPPRSSVAKFCLNVGSFLRHARNKVFAEFSRNTL